MVNLLKSLLPFVDKKPTKRGFFYILDAVIAFLVLVVGIIVILSNSVSVQSTHQATSSATNFLDQLSSVRLNQVGEPYILNLRRIGVFGVEDERKAIMQIIYEQYLAGNVSIAEDMTSLLAGTYMLEILNVEFRINEDLVYSRYPNSVPLHRAPFAVVQRRLVFGVDGTTKFGPYTAEVTVW